MKGLAQTLVLEATALRGLQQKDLEARVTAIADRLIKRFNPPASRRPTTETVAEILREELLRIERTANDVAPFPHFIMMAGRIERYFDMVGRDNKPARGLPGGDPL